MNKIIKKHALMLLSMYGVREELLKEHPEALNTFIKLLEEELYEHKK